MKGIQRTTGNKHPELEFIERDRKSYLLFHFQGYFTLNQAKKLATAWGGFCDPDPEKSFVHIWDCQHMSGFEVAAKRLWMESLDQYSQQTEEIILVSDNIVIRGAARLMSKFTKHKLSIHKSLPSDFEEEYGLRSF